MSYFLINDIDFSMYVNELKVNSEVNYTAQTNAAGNTVVDYINKKRTVEVGFIPMDGEAMIRLLQAIDAFNVSISFRNPVTNDLEEHINCIIPSNNIEYYTIQINKVLYNTFTLQFIEL